MGRIDISSTASVIDSVVIYGCCLVIVLRRQCTIAGAWRAWFNLVVYHLFFIFSNSHLDKPLKVFSFFWHIHSILARSMSKELGITHLMIVQRMFKLGIKTITEVKSTSGLVLYEMVYSTRYVLPKSVWPLSMVLGT